MSIILASGSVPRRRLLASAGVAFRVVPADINEDEREGEGMLDRGRRLAKEKALAVPGEIVIGSDQVGAIGDGGVELRKPWDRAVAKEQLTQMSGRSHTFLSAAAIAVNGTIAHEVEASATVTFHALSEAEIERYLDLGEWRGSAGSYHLEGHGARLVAALEGHEATVYGLPLFEILAILRTLRPPAPAG